jgi:hypothetical protein
VAAKRASAATMGVGAPRATGQAVGQATGEPAQLGGGGTAGRGKPRGVCGRPQEPSVGRAAGGTGRRRARPARGYWGFFLFFLFCFYSSFILFLS